MYLEYYGMREQPFGVTPDPRFLFLTPSHREALASLYFGVESGRGFLALIAPPGMGKTTLLFQLLERLEGLTKTVFLFQTQCDSREFIRYVLEDLGIESSGKSLVQMHQELCAAVEKQAGAGGRFVIVVDEAQNLGNSVLETARLLSNLETPNSKLIQIILAGQLQLADKLNRPELDQLRQRFAVTCRLNPLSPVEVGQYISHRLRVAGYDGAPLFTSDALRIIANASEGIPRNINTLCFNALSAGFALNRKKVDRSILEEVIRDLNFGALPPEPLIAPHAAELPIIPTVEELRSSSAGGAPASRVAPEFLVGRSLPRGSGGQRPWLWLAAGAFLVASSLAGSHFVATRPPASSDGTAAAASPDKNQVSSSPASPGTAGMAASSDQGATPAAERPGANPPSDEELPAGGSTLPDQTGKIHTASAPSAPPDDAALRQKITRLCRKGDDYLDAGNYDKALRQYRAALELDPVNADVLDKIRTAEHARATEQLVLR